jgi:hypothetical protein
MAFFKFFSNIFNAYVHWVNRIMTQEHTWTTRDFMLLMNILIFMLFVGFLVFVLFSHLPTQ